MTDFVRCVACNVDHEVIQTWPGLGVLVECPKAEPGKVVGIDLSYVKMIDGSPQGCDTVDAMR